jgi:hypothetical protein
MDDELNRLEPIFGKVTRADSQYRVNLSAKIYPQFIKVFKPNQPYLKKIPFMEDHIDDGDNQDVEDWPTRIIDGKTSNEDNLERALRKTKTSISDLILCNEFDLFATFTVSPKKSDRLNPVAVKIQMANWLRNQRKQYGKFHYLIVPEFHKDHKALHFHALFRKYNGKLVDSGKTSKGRPVLYFGGYTLGFNSAVRIDNIEKVSGYVKKYITKDMPQFRSQHRFWTSTGLKRPIVIDNPDPKLMQGEPLRTFENEYGVTYYFPIVREGSDEE